MPAIERILEETIPKPGSTGASCSCHETAVAPTEDIPCTCPADRALLRDPVLLEARIDFGPVVFDKPAAPPTKAAEATWMAGFLAVPLVVVMLALVLFSLTPALLVTTVFLMIGLAPLLLVVLFAFLTAGMESRHDRRAARTPRR